MLKPHSGQEATGRDVHEILGDLDDGTVVAILRLHPNQNFLRGTLYDQHARVVSLNEHRALFLGKLLKYGMYGFVAAKFPSWLAGRQASAIRFPI
jgi:hypothetical protein